MLLKLPADLDEAKQAAAYMRAQPGITVEAVSYTHLDVYKRQGVDSFNVSVAAGIILYEIQSQRAAE